MKKITILTLLIVCVSNNAVSKTIKERVDILDRLNDENNTMIGDNYRSIQSNVIAIKQLNNMFNDKSYFPPDISNSNDKTKIIDTNTININNESINKNTESIKKEAIERVKAIDVNAKAIEANDSNIKYINEYAIKNRNMITGKNSAIKENTNQISKLKSDFKKLSKDFNDFKSQTNGAIAGVAAMSTLTQPYDVGNFNIGFGVGAYDGENAIAVGVGYRYDETMIFKGALSASTGDKTKPILSASINYEF